jgi:hypothetical protein
VTDLIVRRLGRHEVRHCQRVHAPRLGLELAARVTTVVRREVAVVALLADVGVENAVAAGLVGLAVRRAAVTGIGWVAGLARLDDVVAADRCEAHTAKALADPRAGRTRCSVGESRARRDLTGSDATNVGGIADLISWTRGAVRTRLQIGVQAPRDAQADYPDGTHRHQFSPPVPGPGCPGVSCRRLHAQVWRCRARADLPRVF